MGWWDGGNGGRMLGSRGNGRVGLLGVCARGTKQDLVAWWYSNLLHVHVHGARRYFGGSRLPCTCIVLLRSTCMLCRIPRYMYRYVPVLADVGYNPLFATPFWGFRDSSLIFMSRERCYGGYKNVHLRFVAKNIARITVQ